MCVQEFKKKSLAFKKYICYGTFEKDDNKAGFGTWGVFTITLEPPHCGGLICHTDVCITPDGIDFFWLFFL